MKNKNIIPDPWLSNIIGKPSYKVIKFQKNIFNKIKKNCFYYYKCKFCNSAEINALYKYDFQFIQNDITLKTKTSSFNNKINLKNCRFIKKNEKINLNQITDNSFYYSRFYNDNNISKKISKKIKRKWIDGYFSNTRGDMLIGYFVQKKIYGYLLLKKNQKQIVIDLIAVNKNYRKQKISTKMISYLFNEFKNHEVIVGTQLLNTPSIKLYLKFGFKFAKIDSIYHLHS